MASDYAAQELRQPNGEPQDRAGEQEQSPSPASGASGSFFIPKDVLGGHTCEAGESGTLALGGYSIPLTVVGHDADGDLEVSIGGGESQDWRSELRGKLKEAGQTEQEHQTTGEQS